MNIRLIRIYGRYNYERAAEVFAVLAYPDASDTEIAHAASLFCAWYAQELLRSDNVDHAIAASIIRPAYLLRQIDDIEAFGRKTCILLQHRLRAGHIAAGVLQGVTGVQPGLEPELLGKRTIENILGFVAQQDGCNEDNLRKRSWKPSRKVLSLSTALAFVSQGARPGQKEIYDFFGLMALGTAFAELMLETARMEALIDRCEPLRFLRTDLIRFRFDLEGQGSYAA